MAQPLPFLASWLVGLLLPIAASAQGRRVGSASPEIFEALALKSGGTACEVGAGDGERSLAAAERVGRQGPRLRERMGDERVRTLRTR